MAVQIVDKPAVVEPSDDRPQAGVHWWDRVANVYENKSGSSRIVPMEGVRGFAVLLVFFVHFHVAFSAYMGFQFAPSTYQIPRKWEAQASTYFSSSAAI